MSDERDFDLVDDLRSMSSEASWLEFKQDNSNPEAIGKLCSALSNSARVDNRDLAYVLWGIADDDHSVTGTQFNPDSTTVGNQAFQIWLAQRLIPSVDFRFREIHHPDGRIVLLEIPAATTAPTAFNNIPYIRIGSATTKLQNFPGRYENLINSLRPFSWENGLAKDYASGDDVLELLDYSQYFRLTDQALPDNRQGIFERLCADCLIKPDVGSRWAITNLGAILFATDLEKFEPPIHRKAIRFIAYDGENRSASVTHRKDEKSGYACGFENLVSFINSLLPRNEHIGEALRVTHPLFPELAI